MGSLTVQDLEIIQSKLSDYRLELVDGEDRVMSLSGYESNEVASRIAVFMGMWVLPRNKGTIVGIPVNPEDRTVELRCANQEPLILRDEDTLTIPDVLPGWEVAVADLWAPVFEED